jgi:hypothetical protein
MKNVNEVMLRILFLREKEGLLYRVSQGIESHDCGDDAKQEVLEVLDDELNKVQEELKTLEGVGVKRIPKRKRKR